MSIPALNWALEAQVKNSGQKLVLIILANYADEHGEAWPSQETIAAKGCMTSRAVRSHLGHLEAQDLISRTHRYKKDGTFNTDAYKLHIDNQRKNLPTEKSSDGKKRHDPAEDFSANPSVEPSKQNNSTARTHTREEPPPETSDFDRFWEAYPKKRSKGQARKAWKALNPSEQLVADILEAIERAKTSDDWQQDGGQFIPHPASWLRAEGWLDEYEPQTQSPASARNTKPGGTLDNSTRGSHHETHRRSYQSAQSQNEDAIREGRARRAREQGRQEDGTNVLEGLFERVRR